MSPKTFSSDQTTTLTPQGSARRDPADVGLVLLHSDAFIEMPPVFVLASPLSFVGRQPPPNNLTIPQSSVSRVHAQLARNGTEVKVTDLNSRNGTFVNGQRVTESSLRHGDVVRFGDAVFRLVTTKASRYAPFRLDGEWLGAGTRRSLPEMVGGFRLTEVAEEIASLAATKAPVLVLGATGTGKEGIARALHQQSGRPGPFRAINCAAIPAQLVESELFGHRKGAFTGANRDAPGMFRATEKGTLLLDEIGDMPLDAQAKLLRVLETREVVAVGAYEPEAVDVRIVAATHRDLRALVDQGAFRADLYARLNGYTLRLPALRERLEDVPVLLRHFMQREQATQPIEFSFIYPLFLYDWPFNVRELAGVVSRAVTLSKGKPLTLEHLPEQIQAALTKTSEARAVEVSPPEPTGAVVVPSTRRKRPTPDELIGLIRDARGNIAAVARALHRDRALVHRWLKDAGIDPESFREG